VFSKARVINTLGNRAVHGHRPIPPDDAWSRCASCSTWRTGSPAPTAARRDRRRAWPSTAALPKATPVRGQTAEQLQQLEAGLRERDEKLAALLADKARWTRS
jgi:type I restriction enzyme, R subunit